MTVAHLTNYERETIVNFNEGEDTASVYTHNKPLRRRLEQLAQERPEECRLFKVSHWDQAVEYYPGYGLTPPGNSARHRGKRLKRPVLPQKPLRVQALEMLKNLRWAQTYPSPRTAKRRRKS